MKLQEVELNYENFKNVEGSSELLSQTVKEFHKAYKVGNKIIVIGIDLEKGLVQERFYTMVLKVCDLETGEIRSVYMDTEAYDIRIHGIAGFNQRLCPKFQDFLRKLVSSEKALKDFVRYAYFMSCDATSNLVGFFIDNPSMVASYLRIFRPVFEGEQKKELFHSLDSMPKAVQMTIARKYFPYLMCKPV